MELLLLGSLMLLGVAVLADIHPLYIPAAVLFVAALFGVILS